ncbi:MAG: hypothetical protein ABIJ16_01100, partial [Bacteroidota bacterium]
AHYYLRHSVTEYIADETGEFDRGIFRDKSSSKYDINQELEADSMAMMWIIESGYHINGLLYSFEIIDWLEDRYVRRQYGEWNMAEKTHPLGEKRMIRIINYCKKHKIGEGQVFLISEEKFNRLKKEALPEILGALLESYEYDQCIESSFKFHLFDPDNVIYIYYLMESIRRKCYLDINEWNRNFITYRYYDTLNVNGARMKERVTHHLFKNFDFYMVPVRQREAMKIKAKFYWTDEARFTTNEQAFEYFYHVSQKLGCTECILSNALSLIKDTDKKNNLLDEYLGHNTIQHREFARNFRDGTLYDCLKNRSLIAMDLFDVIVRLGKKDVPIPVQMEKPYIISGIFDSLCTGRDNTVQLYLNQFRDLHLNDYLLLKHLEELSFISTVSLGQKPELFIIDPRYWEIMSKLEVNEIIFLNCLYFESRSTAKSIDDYYQVVSCNYDSIFERTKSTRYLDIVYSSVRLKKNALMKVLFYGGEVKMKWNEPAYSRIISEMKYTLKEMEMKILELDIDYKTNGL